MIVLNRHGIRVGEVWFDEQPESAGADVLVFYECPRPLSRLWTMDFYTIEIDLTAAESAIFAGMKKEAQQKVNQAARKDQLEFEFWEMASVEVAESFCEFFDGFAQSRGISLANRGWMRSYAEAGVLSVSRVSRNDGTALVWHTYYRGRSRARQLHSASNYRNAEDPSFRGLVGRANRFHHWHDMLRFKQIGLSVFDLGGWYQHKDDEQMLRINEFKEAFGGRVAKHYYCVQPVTLKGAAFLVARTLRNPRNRFLQMF